MPSYSRIPPWKPLKPLAWSITDETLEVHSDDFIHNLRLPVGLGWNVDVKLSWTPESEKSSFQN
jgi:hypothetical protein